MTMLATKHDLELALEDDLETERAEFLIRVASGEVIAATGGNTFELVVDDVQVFDGHGSRILILPVLPVNDVLSVIELPYGTVDEVDLDGPDAEVPRWEWSASGILRRVDGLPFARRFRAYEVTYSHGLAVVPDVVIGVVCRVAGRSYNNPDGTAQETLGRYSYTLAGSEARVGLFGADLAELEPYSIGPGADPYRIPNPLPTGSGS